MATTDPRAVEVLRAWVTPGGPCQVTLRTLFDDPATWGLLLVDLARHAAQAYGREGHDEDRVLRRIWHFLELERGSPTTPVIDLTDES
jgi:hypothetical protein